jgi:hypothetical protein
MKKFLFSCLISISACYSFGQGESNKWLFGNNGGLISTVAILFLLEAAKHPPAKDRQAFRMLQAICFFIQME